MHYRAVLEEEDRGVLEEIEEAFLLFQLVPFQALHGRFPASTFTNSHQTLFLMNLHC